MPIWLAITIGIITGLASLSAVFALAYRAVDRRMDEKVALGSGDVQRLAAKLENGIIAEIREQGQKIDLLMQGLAEVKGRFDTFIEMWEQSR